MTIVLTQPSPIYIHQSLPTFFALDSDCAHDTPCSGVTRHKTSFTAITCRSRPLPSLPAELHLEIIDVIASRIPSTPNQDQPYDPKDLASLCACSLVCKLWLNTARAGIWAGVRLSGRKKSMALIKLLKAYSRDRDEDRPTLNMPSFGLHVSRLSVRETRGNAWDPKWLDDALPHLAAHLLRVQILEMERITWEYLSSRSRVACLKAFKHVKSLALRGFVFHTSRDMYGFLGEFGELEVLTLDGVHCAKKNTPKWFLTSVVDGKRVVKPPSRMLKEVGLRGVQIETILEWMMTGVEYERELGRSGPGIERVRMGGVGVSEANIVGRFLRGVGKSLRKFHIGFETDFIERGDELVREIELAENTNLEELHIFGLVVPSPPPVDPFEQEPALLQRVLEPLTSLLSQIRSRMRILSLALYPADIHAISTIDFEGLGAVFEKRAWGSLDEVRVVISNEGGYGLGKAVRERLSRLNERGVLRVNVGFDEREIL